MNKKNCWEIKGCGREPGGEREKDLGVCPAATFMPFNNIHGGKAAGRACWVVAGTMCRDKVSGTYAKKLGDCGNCGFYALVKEDEGDRLVLDLDLLSLIDRRALERPYGRWGAGRMDDEEKPDKSDPKADGS